MDSNRKKPSTDLSRRGTACCLSFPRWSMRSSARWRRVECFFSARDRRPGCRQPISGTAGRLEEYRVEVSGANLIVFTLFGLAMFDGVVVRTFTQPWLVVGLSATAFLIALGSIGAAFVFVRALGSDDAFITGFAAGHRNVGLMAAAQSGALPDITWLYFALVQLPIYLTPQLVRQILHFRRQVRLIGDS